MIDDGLSRCEVLKRMDELKLRVEDVKALVLTHEHSDHIKGLAVWCKNWSGSMFCSPQTRCAKPALEELPFTPRRTRLCRQRSRNAYRYLFHLARRRRSYGI